VPAFLIGAGLVLYSKKSFKTRFFTIILPVVLWLPATCTFLYFYGKTTPETFLIPAGFEGPFRIVYGEECGIDPKYENGRRLLKIPDNGILIIKQKQEGGWIDHEYCLVDENGNRSKMESNIAFDKNIKLPGVTLKATGMMGNITTADFYVTNKDTADIETSKFRDQFDSLTFALVENCRSHK
jgi:hypothetical protein